MYATNATACLLAIATRLLCGQNAPEVAGVEATSITLMHESQMESFSVGNTPIERRAIRLNGQFEELEGRVNIWRDSPAYRSTPADAQEAVDALLRELRGDMRTSFYHSFDGRRQLGIKTDLIEKPLAFAEKIYEMISGILDSKEAFRLKVSTQITSDEPEAPIHFKTGDEFKRDRGSWKSYTDAQPMRIGNYYFRVIYGPDEIDRYYEEVPIYEHPKIHMLRVVKE